MPPKAAAIFCCISTAEGSGRQVMVMLRISPWARLVGRHPPPLDPRVSRGYFQKHDDALIKLDLLAHMEAFHRTKQDLQHPDRVRVSGNRIDQDRALQHDILCQMRRKTGAILSLHRGEGEITGETIQTAMKGGPDAAAV